MTYKKSVLSVKSVLNKFSAGKTYINYTRSLYLLYKNEIINNNTPKETKTIVFAIVSKCAKSYKNNFTKVSANKTIPPIRKCCFFFHKPRAIKNKAYTPQKILKPNLSD